METISVYDVFVCIGLLFGFMIGVIFLMWINVRGKWAKKVKK